MENILKNVHAIDIMRQNKGERHKTCCEFFS